MSPFSSGRLKSGAFSLMSMTRYLYPKLLRYAIAAMVVMGSVHALGQYRRTQPRLTPRALAVLELDAKGGSRLFPVMIMIDGKFYDASLYGAKPVPLSLWSETVYEVQKSGMPLGLFTVNLARGRLGETTWWGEGRWKPFSTAKKGKAGTGSTAEKAEPKPGDANAAAANGADKAQSEHKTEPALKDDDDSDRPVLKKPAGDAAPASEDKSPKPEPAEPKGTVLTKTAPEDPDRPVLRRGKPGDTETVQAETYEILDVGKAKKAMEAQRGPVEFLPAISDPKPTDNRTFDMPLSAEEQARYGAELAKLASNELRKFTAGQTPSPISANGTFSNVSIRSYDLDYSNNPLLVFTAEYEPVAQPSKFEAAGTAAGRKNTLYVTFVGKVDLQGTIRKLFAAATDTLHLDAYPRFELIDAVDADGDSRGELLFREISDIDRRYVVYRASPYWTKLFEGGAGL